MKLDSAASAQAPCPCGSGPAYAACCARFHAGPLHLQAPTAEALMRSRYSAHVLGLGGYLRESWHAGTRPAEVPVLDPALRWLGLQVRRHQMLADGSAVVEFVARSKLAGRAGGGTRRGPPADAAAGQT